MPKRKGDISSLDTATQRVFNRRDPDSNRFIKTSKQAELLKDKVLKLTNANMKATKVAERINKQYTVQGRALHKSLKQNKALDMLTKRQTQTMSRQAAQLQKVTRQYRSLNREISKSVAPRGGGGRGGGFGLPAFLSVAALAGATRGMARYTSQLARTRDMARALGGVGGRQVNQFLPNRREAELFSAFAGQSFSNRFASSGEIKGLQNIRETLRKSLGSEAATGLTLELTKALQGSSEELQRFLSMASQNVPQALRAFQSADVESFSTALAAATVKGDELTSTVSTMEKAWQDVQDSFERAVTSFVKQHGGDLSNLFQDLSQDVVGIINSGRRWAAEWKPVFRFIVGGLNVVRDAAQGLGIIGDEIAAAPDFARQRAIDKQIDVLFKAADAAKAAGDKGANQRLLDQIRNLQRQRSGIVEGLNDRYRDTAKQIEDLTLGTAEHVEDIALNTERAVKAAQRERSELERTATQAERIAVQFSRISESLEIQDLTVGLSRSRLEAAKSGIAGFGVVPSLILSTVAEIDKKREALQKQLALIQSIEHKTRQDRITALQLETQINQTIAERNSLLRDQQRGYLDAVQAQALAAGRFSKILTTQELNLGVALRKSIARTNAFLGSVGSVSPVEPFRYSTVPGANIENQLRHATQMNQFFSGQGVPRAFPALSPSYQSALVSRSGNTRVKSSSDKVTLIRNIGDAMHNLAELEQVAQDTEPEPVTQNRYHPRSIVQPR